MTKNNNLALVAFTAAVWVLSGCVPPPDTTRANPRLYQQAPLIRTVALLPAEIKVFQIDAGGVREEMAEWSAQAHTNIIAAVENELRAKLKAEVKFLNEESLSEEKARFEETRALYAAVAAMIFIHTFPNPNFPSHLFDDKRKNFDYSLGSEVSALAPGAAALLILDAQDHVWTAGRQALQALGVILGIGAAVGTGAVVMPQLGGGTSVRAALVDGATGDILWINAIGSGAGKDLRNPTSANDMVSQLFKDFPIGHDRQSEQEKAR
jgi:hypothetical protein